MRLIIRRTLQGAGLVAVLLGAFYAPKVYYKMQTNLGDTNNLQRNPRSKAEQENAGVPEQHSTEGTGGRSPQGLSGQHANTVTDTSIKTRDVTAKKVDITNRAVSTGAIQAGQDAIVGQDVTINKGPALTDARTEGETLVLEFQDGRRLRTLLATQEMADRLKLLAESEPVTQEDLAGLAKVTDIANLATVDSLSDVTSALSTVSSKLAGLDVASLKQISRVGLAKLEKLINDPESFKGADGISGRDGRDGKDGDAGAQGLPVTGLQGEQGSDGADGADGISIVGLYFDTNKDLIVQLSHGEPELNAGPVPLTEHEHPIATWLPLATLNGWYNVDDDKPLSYVVDTSGEVTIQGFIKHDDPVPRRHLVVANLPDSITPADLVFSDPFLYTGSGFGRGGRISSYANNVPGYYVLVSPRGTLLISLPLAATTIDFVAVRINYRVRP